MRRFTPHAAASIAMKEPAGRMRFVRRLVLRKAHVAMNAEHRFLRRTEDLRNEIGQPHVDVLDQQSHRRAQRVLVVVTMRLEPLLPIVLGETAQERHRLRGKTVERVGHAHLSRRSEVLNVVQETENGETVRCVRPMRAHRAARRRLPCSAGRRQPASLCAQTCDAATVCP